MAVSYPTQTVTSAQGASVTSLTYAYTSPTGQSNTVILVGVANGDGSGGVAKAISTVTYAAAGLTKIGEKASVWSGNEIGRATLWRRVNPATGANNVVVTPASQSDIESGVWVFAGVDQTTPERGTPATASSPPDTTQTTATVDQASNADDMVADVVATGSNVGTSSQTERWELNQNTSSGGGNGGGSTAAGGATVTMSYTITQDVWAMVAASMQAAAAAFDVSLTPGIGIWSSAISGLVRR